MTVYKRPGTRFYTYDFVLDGVRYKGSTKRTTEREARLVENQKRREVLDRGQLGVLEEMSLGDAVARYLKESRRKRDHRGECNRGRKLLGVRLDPNTGEEGKRWGLSKDMKLHEITQRHLNDLVNARVDEGLAANTINRELEFLQRVINRAKVWGVRVPPLEFSRKNGGPKLVTQEKLRYLDLDEERRFLDELEPTKERYGLPPLKARSRAFQAMLQDQYDLAVFGLDTGARYSEIATILWTVVDWGANTINLYRSKVGNEGTLTMTRRLRAVLERRRRESNSAYIFPSKDGKGCRGYATSGIHKAMNRAGLNAPHLVERYGKATFHTLRDTFASRLVQNGVPLYTVQCLLGHTNPRMTQKYAHLAPNRAAAEAARVLDAVAAA